MLCRYGACDAHCPNLNLEDLTLDVVVTDDAEQDARSDMRNYKHNPHVTFKSRKDALGNKDGKQTTRSIAARRHHDASATTRSTCAQGRPAPHAGPPLTHVAIMCMFTDVCGTQRQLSGPTRLSGTA